MSAGVCQQEWQQEHVAARAWQREGGSESVAARGWQQKCGSERVAARAQRTTSVKSAVIEKVSDAIGTIVEIRLPLGMRVRWMT
mgnify:CR=1 FL=1|jgi:hypothetical protein